MGNDTTPPLPFDAHPGDPPGGGGDAPDALPTRVFLGSDAPLPTLAARWLLSELRDDERAEVLVAVPGSRAKAALVEALQAGAARAPTGDWPEVLTVGQLGDLLARPTLDELARSASAAPRAASRVERSLIWQQRLDALPDAARELLLPARADTPAARRALAASLRGLHADLAAADLDGVDLAEGIERAAPDRERWLVFAELQRQVLKALAERGLADPHALRRATSRLAARAVPRVVLLGVVDASPLLEHQIAHRVARVDVLLPGDADTYAALHDAWGRVLHEPFERRAIPDLVRRWTLHENPDAQADALLAAYDAHVHADADARSVELCLPDPELLAPVRRRLAERGAGLREASGRAWRRTPVARLLAALRAHLTRPTAASFAALLRAPALEAWLAARDVPSPARRLDAYHETHLPAALPKRWRALPGGRFGSGARADALRAAGDALAELLGPLADDVARPAPALVDALRALLAALASTPVGAALLADAGARRLAELLTDAARLPHDARLRAAELLELLDDALADAKVDGPSQPAGPERVAVGELPFSSAGAVLLAGFQEGALPAARRGHPWLPDGVCQELGLPHAAAQRARAQWALECAVARGVELRLFSGRRSREGDPRRPSRLAFRGDDAEALRVAEHALAPAEEAPAPAPVVAAAPPRPLLPARAPLVESLSVTDFDAFLGSPYQCFVERILRRLAQDDDAHELDGGAFGSLAHELLEGFGTSELASSTSADELAAWFDAQLGELAARRFGPEVAPAVNLQLRQLAWRLRQFARWQAKHAEDGWRIAHVEWKPAEPVDVRFGDQHVKLRGRIDRIDLHDDGRWLLLDYKTSDGGASPRADHGGKDGVWKKLQLPLYLELVRELQRELGRGVPELGYLVLPKSETRSALAPADWSVDELAHARRTAGEIVRRLRAGEVTALGPGRYLADDPSLRALSGVGLVGGPRTAALGDLVPRDDDAGDDRDAADGDTGSAS